MYRTNALVMALLGTVLSTSVLAEGAYFLGQPEYQDSRSQALVTAMLEAHGGTQAWSDAEVLSFRFVTKVVGGGAPFYSIEKVALDAGATYIEWPWLQATTGWDGTTVWSKNWPMPIPPGFFTHLTTSFITMPWLTQHDDAVLSYVGHETLPKSEDEMEVVRLTFDAPGPHVPGNYYELFIDPERKLLRAVRFDITHPRMVANPNQPIGPNIHVFEEYRSLAGLVVPTYYVTHGTRQGQGSTAAVHMVFDMSLEGRLEPKQTALPEGGVVDTATAQWWQGSSPD